MLRNRTLIAVLALVAVPFVAAAAQGNSNFCSPTQALQVARARANHEQVPPGLAKKCPPPPPAVEQPPTGIHYASGTVYDDADGNGSWDPYAGEMPLAGWTVQLFWKGTLVTSLTTDDYGRVDFMNLGASTDWAVCLVVQAGYSRTQPVSGDACGGAGYMFSVPVSTAQTQFPAVFGVMLQ